MDCKNLSNEDLNKYLEDLDHREEDDDEYNVIHIYWDCKKCKVESEISRRELMKISKLPGSLPYLKNYSLSNKSISKLCVGDFAAYASRPGISTYVSDYAECLNIAVENDKFYYVTWRKTNTLDKPFTVLYDADEMLNITSPMKRND